MRWRIRTNPARVQFTPTLCSSSRDPGTSTPAARRNAAEDRSPGTVTWSSSSSSTFVTATRGPRRSIPTPARASRRSVWSRLGVGSVTATSPWASSPAIRTHDLTWALATGSS